VPGTVRWSGQTREQFASMPFAFSAEPLLNGRFRNSVEV
jgi:hypothetical protein